MECMLDKIERLERCLHAFRQEFNFKMKIVQQLLSARTEQLTAHQKSVEQESSLYKFLLTSWGDYDGIGQDELFQLRVEPLPSAATSSAKRGQQPRRSSHFASVSTNGEKTTPGNENSGATDRTETIIECKVEVPSFVEEEISEGNSESITPDNNRNNNSNVQSERPSTATIISSETHPVPNQILIQSSDYEKDGFDPEEIEILPGDHDHGPVFIQVQEMDTRMDEGVIIITDDEEEQRIVNENSNSSVEMRDDTSFGDVEIVHGGEGSSSSNVLSGSESPNPNTALVLKYSPTRTQGRGFGHGHGHCHRGRMLGHPHRGYHGFGHRPLCSQSGFLCHYCGRNFSQSATLNQHKKLHLEGKDLRCHLCENGDVSVEFAQLDFLVQHMKNHHGIERQTCQLCSKDFAGPTYLKRHMCIFHGENNGAGQLTQGHIGTNGSAKRNKQCSLCPKRYQTRADLLVHIRKHTGEKPYFCSGCQRHFADTRNLKRHEERFPDCKNANQSQQPLPSPALVPKSSSSTVSSVRSGSSVISLQILPSS